jgi:hypothetical protein
MFKTCRCASASEQGAAHASAPEDAKHMGLDADAANGFARNTTFSSGRCKSFVLGKGCERILGDEEGG